MHSCETPPKPWLCSTLSEPHTKMALFSSPLSPFSFSLTRLFISLPPNSHLLSSIPVLLSLSQPLSQRSTFPLLLSLFFLRIPIPSPLLLFCLEDQISGLPCFILCMLSYCLFSLEENLYDFFKENMSPKAEYIPFSHCPTSHRHISHWGLGALCLQQDLCFHME